MATPDVPASVALYDISMGLRAKGHYARAAEKFGRAADAAAQELAAEDCLVVAFLRAGQAQALICHSCAPSLTAAERVEARESVVSVLLPQLVLTATRRKAAGTLLPGSCRAAEVAWWRCSTEHSALQDGMPLEVACAGAEAHAPTLGFEVYMFAAGIAFNVLGFMEPSVPREMQLSHVALVVSALELMAQPRKLPSGFVDGMEKFVLASSSERYLARTTCHMLMEARNSRTTFNLDVEAFVLLDVAWQRVQRSGALAMRLLDGEQKPGPTVKAGLDAAAAEAAVRGLRECALAGCSSKEVHVSQFGKCGSCKQAFYCCREHQLADWPAHKAACKAARKVAVPSK